MLNSKSRFKVIVWHRKAHKTTLAINELVRRAFMTVGTYWYVAPLLKQAKKIVWDEPEMLAKYVPESIWRNRNNSEMKIRFPNGSMVYVLGADNPDSLRGPNPRGVVLDEYGDMKLDVWGAIIQPIMTANPEGWTWFTGTPKGRNHFYSILQHARGQKSAAWESWVLKASESGILSQESLDEARSTTSQAFYNQEYECEFLDNATSFFRRIRENTYEPTGKEYAVDHDYQLGIDLAKYQDWTVITPFDLNEFKVLPQDRFNQIDWNLQKARIQVAWHQYNKGQAVIDATGVGDPIVEDLANAGMTVSPFKFSERTKKELLTHLAVMIEQDKIQLPADEELFAELESIQWELGEKGKSRISTLEGMTDDRVMSLALAVWGHLTPLQLKRARVTEPIVADGKYDGTITAQEAANPFFSTDEVARM